MLLSAPCFAPSVTTADCRCRRPRPASMAPARRGLLQHLAGNEKTTELAWRDEQSLRLPAVIDQFPDPQLNRQLYIWLTALAAGGQRNQEPWFSKNQRLTVQTLQAWPGLRCRYRRLMKAYLAQRILPGKLLAAEAAQEQAANAAPCALPAHLRKTSGKIASSVSASGSVPCLAAWTTRRQRDRSGRLPALYRRQSDRAVLPQRMGLTKTCGSAPGTSPAFCLQICRCRQIPG